MALFRQHAHLFVSLVFFDLFTADTQRPAAALDRDVPVGECQHVVGPLR